MPIPLKAFTERRRAGLDDSATEKLLDSDEKGHEQAPGLSANRVATALKKVLQVAGRGCKQKTKWRVLEEPNLSKALQPVELQRQIPIVRHGKRGLAEVRSKTEFGNQTYYELAFRREDQEPFGASEKAEHQAEILLLPERFFMSCCQNMQ